VLDVQQLIAKAYELEPIPMSGAKLASLVADPESTLASIIEVVSLDQALAGRTLRVANSAGSAARSTITTVKDAVIRLGRSTIVTLGFGTKMRAKLQQAVPEFGLAENMLWRHSVATALVAESMASLCKVTIPPESYVSALLHDIGKLVLARFLDQDLLSYLERAQAEGRCNPLQAEMEILEVNHAELGGLIVRHWGLPESIAMGVQYHHGPDIGHPVVCDVVCVANVLANSIVTAGKPPLYPEDHTRSFQALGVDAALAERIRVAVDARFVKVLEIFGM
jgi:putative nucleotidyltransferase with HDIG domain